MLSRYTDIKVLLSLLQAKTCLTVCQIYKHKFSCLFGSTDMEVLLCLLDVKYTGSFTVCQIYRQNCLPDVFSLFIAISTDVDVTSTGLMCVETIIHVFDLKLINKPGQRKF